MSVYVGTPIGTTLISHPVCFTGWHAILLRALLAGGEVLLTAAAGAALGAVLSLTLGPEPTSKILFTFIGAGVGAVAGGALAILFLVQSMCPCPPGTTGFCVRFIFLAMPGGIPVPLWPFFLPDPAFCPTLVPPGCP